MRAELAVQPGSQAIALPGPVLVTGATGIVGAPLVAALERTGVEVVGCSARGSETAVRWRMGVEEPPLTLRRRWATVVHAAADTRWNLAADHARAANVDSTAALVAVTPADAHVVHISTAFAGGIRGDVESPDLDDYHNTYEWSKAEAERLVASTWERLTIVRPPLVVGSRRDGAVTRFSGLYTLLHGIARGFAPAIVGRPDAPIDVVSTDDVVDVVRRAAVAGPRLHDRVRVLGSGIDAPSLREVTDQAMASFAGWRAERCLRPVDTPPILAPDRWDRFFLPFAREHFSPLQRRVVDSLGEFRPYLDGSSTFVPNEPVPSMLPHLDRCVRYWADHARATWRVPQPWAPRPAGTNSSVT